MFQLVSCVAPSSLFPLEKHLPIAINTCSSPPNAGSFGCSDALRYHSPPKALFGGKLDRSALVESVVLLACRGGLQDQEVSVRATAGRAREEAHTIPESSLLLGSLFLLLVFFCFSRHGAQAQAWLASCFRFRFPRNTRQYAATVVAKKIYGVHARSNPR